MDAETLSHLINSENVLKRKDVRMRDSMLHGFLLLQDKGSLSKSI